MPDASVAAGAGSQGMKNNGSAILAQEYEGITIMEISSLRLGDFYACLLKPAFNEPFGSLSRSSRASVPVFLFLQGVFHCGSQNRHTQPFHRWATGT